jgi:Ca2+-binding RTX toxin-like protein
VHRLLACLVVLVSLPAAAPAQADHVSSNPQVSARLGERISDNSWSVIVDWSINCSGAAAPNYSGDLNLIDVDTGERIYMGGTFGPSDSTRQPVDRRALPRRVMPELRASCFDSPPLPHGSGTKTVTGNTVTVPGKGDEDGDGRPDATGGRGSNGDRPGAPAGGQGRRDFRGFGDPDDPLRPGGCARVREGTSSADNLLGTSGPDLILGIGGNDLIVGRSSHDCLIGGPGRDRLIGDSGYDRLTGGGSGDSLFGGRGVDRYDAGAGNDFVNAADGRRELVSCGSGRDFARADRRDRVRRCERVRRVR